MKNLFLLLALFISSITIAQNTCEADEKPFEELNSITKCDIESSEKTNNKSTRSISVKVSASKKRYLKKRKKAFASGINSELNTSGISNISNSSLTSNSLELEKNNTTINAIAALSNTISKEEVEKAIALSETSNIPKFKSCKNTDKKKAINCFNIEMAEHIEKHFNYPNAAIINKIEGKVWVRFVIDKTGNITNIKTLGPDVKDAEILTAEAVRVVSKLPKFIPGKDKGKKVSVKYGFPILFSLDN